MNDALSVADNFLNSSFIQAFLIGILVYIAVLWIAIILWVTRDITNRTDNIILQIISICLVIFLTPIFGLIIYLIIRPARTIAERYFEDFEYDMLETEDQNRNIENCGYCFIKVSNDYLYCPGCGAELHKKCGSCKKAIMINWENCVHCGTKQVEKGGLLGDTNKKIHKTIKKKPAAKKKTTKKKKTT